MCSVGSRLLPSHCLLFNHNKEKLPKSNREALVSKIKVMTFRQKFYVALTLMALTFVGGHQVLHDFQCFNLEVSTEPHAVLMFAANLLVFVFFVVIVLFALDYIHDRLGEIED